MPIVCRQGARLASISVVVALGLLATGCSADLTTAGADASRASDPVHAAATPSPTLTDTPTRGTTPAPTATLQPAPTAPTLAAATAPPATATTPPSEAEPTPTATPQPEPTPQPEGLCGAGPLAQPDPDRPYYRGELTVDPPSRTATGSITVDFTPDRPIPDLVVRLWPNGPRQRNNGVTMTVTSLVVDGVPIDLAEAATDDPTLLRVNLDQPAPAGRTLTASLDFELVVPNEGRSRLAATDDYMRLGTPFPILPWKPGVGWATEPPTALYAEAVTSPVARYEIAIRVPDGFDVLASGQPAHGLGTIIDDLASSQPEPGRADGHADDQADDRPDGQVDGQATVADGMRQEIWREPAGRDFALTVGRFRTATATAMAPDPVTVTVGVQEGLADDEHAYLAKIVDALEQFSGRFGPYPWPSLTFSITPNLRGGIEFPTHIMQGPNTFGRTTSHEVGHMFFYSLVGNNQGADPWLDEGLASYAEFTYEGTPATPWDLPASGVGHATQPMTYWADRTDLYYASVYRQTGFALMNLGDQAEVDCALARFVAANAHRIAEPADLVAAFEPGFPDFVERMAEMGVVVGGS